MNKYRDFCCNYSVTNGILSLFRCRWYRPHVRERSSIRGYPEITLIAKGGGEGQLKANIG